MRSINSIRNIGFSISSQLIIAVSRYFVRTVFIQVFGIELLGLNGLFLNLLSILCLSELGFSLAVTTILYKPLAEGDIERIKALIHFTRTFFRVVGFIILGGGTLLLPFIHIFIKQTTIPIYQIRVYFILFLISSSITYFNSNKIILLLADQKQYIERIYATVFLLIQTAAQIAVSFIFRSFVVFLVVQVVCVVIQNFMLSRKVNLLYPYLKDRNFNSLLPEDKQQLKKNMTAMVFHKLGGVIVFSSSNLIISSFIGIYEVGLYSNYSLIITSIMVICQQLFEGFTGSIGNVWVTESEIRAKQIFDGLMTINYWVYILASVCLYILLQPFIRLWLGEDYLLNDVVVMILVMNFYFSGTRGVANTYKNVKGLYWNDRYRPVFEIIINLMVSLILVGKLGLIGVFLGTTASMIFVILWVEPYILYKYGFKCSSAPYFMNYIKMFLFMAVVCLILNVIVGFLPNNIIGLILKIIIALIVTNIALFFYWKDTKEFSFIIEILKNSYLKFAGNRN